MKYGFDKRNGPIKCSCSTKQDGWFMDEWFISFRRFLIACDGKEKYIYTQASIETKTKLLYRN